MYIMTQKKKPELTDAENGLVVAGGGAQDEWVKVVTGNKIPGISPGDVMHSTATLVNNTALYI